MGVAENKRAPCPSRAARGSDVAARNLAQRRRKRASILQVPNAGAVCVNGACIVEAHGRSRTQTCTLYLESGAWQRRGEMSGRQGSSEVRLKLENRGIELVSEI